MVSIRLISITSVLIIMLVSACKKKENNTQPSGGGAPLHSNKLTMTLNGNNWSSCSNCYQTSNSGGSMSFSGRTSYSGFNNALTFYFSGDTTGTFSFGSGSNPYTVVYTDTAGTYFHPLTGQITVTAVDTAQYGPTIFKATFNFNSDTIGGKHYTVMNGNADWEKP